jgi:hypothetical protein
MTQRADEPFDRQRLLDPDEVDALFSTANPNPERSGCPSQSTLAELARRERGIDDPGYVHLTRCSDCYGEFRAMQETGKQAASRGARTALWVGAAAAAAVLIAGAAWLYSARQPTRPSASLELLVAQKVAADLRPFADTRSQQSKPDRQSIPLPAARVDLTLRLPTGAEPGAYDVELLDGLSRVVAGGSGNAVIRDYVTTLDISLDLHEVVAGELTLRVRRAGDDWHSYPAVVR